MAKLKNHPNRTLRDDAAAAFDKAEEDHGVFQVNSAQRLLAEQQALIARWDKGGASNRPPYLYPPARPAETSNHVKNGGIAVDIGDWKRFATVAANYGFSHPYPGGDPVHFEFVGIKEAEDASGSYSKTTLDRQNFLNASRDAGLVPDGREGPRTRKAYRKYQEYLKQRGWYDAAIDGIWGPKTQAGHEKYWRELNAPKPPTVEPKPPVTPPSGGAYKVVKVSNLKDIGDVRGLQKIAKRYGGKTDIDNIWGPESQKGFQIFLNRNYRGSIVTWLKSRWGYKGDARLGPVMTAALQKANAANYRAL